MYGTKQLILKFNYVKTVSLTREVHREFADLIPSISMILKVDYIWNCVHLPSWGQLGGYVIEKQQIWLTNSTLLEI
jgi:hypothetical protein